MKVVFTISLSFSLLFVAMTEQTIVTLVTTIAVAIPAIIAALTAWRTSKKLHVVEGKVDVVHELTNANLSAVSGALKIANEKIAGMERMMGEMTTARLDAQAVAMKVQAAPAAVEPADPGTTHGPR